MKQLKTLLLCLLLCIGVAQNSSAGSGAWSQRNLLENVILGIDYTINAPMHSGQESHVYLNREGLVHLNYSREQQSDLSMYDQWRIEVTVEYKVNGIANQQVLEIAYENNNYIYSDYVNFDVNQFSGYDVEVINIEGEFYDTSTSSWITVSNPQNDNRFPDDVELVFELRSEEWYGLDVVGTNPERVMMGFDPSTFRANWSYIPGAEEYDFEWVWIDARSEEYDLLTNGTPPAGTAIWEWAFQLKEPSRVRLNKTHHTIDNTYPDGKLFFRVRGVTKFNETSNGGIIDQIKLGQWTYFSRPSNFGVIAEWITHEIIPNDAFEPEKNWTYQVAYAENGKNVSSVSFFDGSNRGRQSLSYNTSNDITLVSEAKFDYEGRQTISVSPAPVQGRKLGYKSAFNLADPSSGSVTPTFEEEHYDFYTHTPTSAVPLASTDAIDPTRTLGAGQYFSEDNVFTEDLFRAAIPNADGYVYSQTVYRNDGSGRIKEVGGIGYDFRVGGEHSAKKYYVSPTATELIRLFGSNVAESPQGYRKEIVRDANGQYSVSYSDKRGNVIATAITGESPDNLIALEDQNTASVTTSLNSNNIASTPYASIAEHTYFNSIENANITVNYNLNGIIETINSQTVNVGGQTVSLPELCATCKYDLEIKVLTQEGLPIYSTSFPAEHYVTSIDPGNCYNPDGTINTSATPAQESVTLTYNLVAIGEYRIIKKLTVDQESMTQDFENLLDASGVNDPTNFVNEYMSNIDISGCFTDCNDYCTHLSKYQFLEDNPGLTWDPENNPTQQAMIDNCVLNSCSEDELYENFGGEAGDNPTITPTEYSCEAKTNQMLQQITPGGVFYDNVNSSFWDNLLQNPLYFNGNPNATVTIDGTSYTLSELQDPNNYVEAMDPLFLLHHREYCHLTYCNQVSETLDYSFKLISEIGDANWSSSNLFLAPYDQVYTTPSFSYDPFKNHAWDDDGNGNSMLEENVDNYLDSNNFQCPSTGINYTTGSLYDYVEYFVNCMEQDDLDSNIVNSTSYYEQRKRFIFIGLYNQLKQDLIEEHKNTDNPSCYYQTDDNAVFNGPLSEDQMNDQISGVVSGIVNGSDCDSLAFNNAQNWIQQMPEDWIEPTMQSCLEILQSNSLYDPAFNEATLISNSNPGSGTGNLEQLFYDYSIATCPENSWGWFFDPDPDGTNPTVDGNAEYEEIYSLLSTHCTDTILYGIEIDPVPTSTTTNITNQNFTNCFWEILALMNDGVDALNLAGTAPVSTQITVAPPTYQNIADECGGLYGVLNLNSASGIGVTFNFDSDPASPIQCDFALKLKYFDLPNDGILAEDIQYIENPVKYANYTHTDGITYPQVILVDVVLTSGEVVSGFMYGDEFWCIGIGDFTSQTFTDFPDLSDGLPDYESDCIEATLGQAEIDANTYYNGMINDVQNQFQQAMANCITSATENLTLTYELKEYNYTLYYYDLANNLIQTVPPQGVDVLDASHFDSQGVWDNVEPIHRMETRYKYNGLNTLVEQYTPDGAHSDFVLDELYRVRFSQNARQANVSKSSYIKYDELGRVIEAGENCVYNSTGMTDPEYLATLVDDPSYPSASIRQDFTRTHYETGLPSDNGDIAARFTNGQQNLRNTIGAIEHFQAEYPSGSGVPLAGTAVRTVISYSYDAHKNLKEMVYTNYHLEVMQQAHKHTEYEYDLISGNLEEVIYQKGEEDEYRHQYHYDANNRLIRAFTSGDYGLTWEKDSKYFYYLHGTLAREELGEDEVQGMDYAYNLNGWMKGVNTTTLGANRDLGQDAHSGKNTRFGRDAIGFSLGYYANDYTSIENITPFANSTQIQSLNLNDEPTLQNGNNHGSLYNGNISHMVVAMSDNNEQRMDVIANNYRYDQLQRIKAMDVYHNPNIINSNDFSTVGLYREQNGESAFQTRYAFDKNGNLTSLKRNGSGRDQNGNTIALTMDNFTYNYYQTSSNTASSATNPEESNRLSYVTDPTPNINYDTDIDGGQTSGNYTYDAIGQLTQDLDEEIESIQWTVTGKIKRINFTSGSSKNDLKFVYDPMDMRTMKVEYLNDNNSAIKYTYYSYDVQGNVMATYNRIQAQQFALPGQGEDKNIDKVTLNEHMIYGSRRIGVEKQVKLLVEAEVIDNSGSNEINFEDGINLSWINHQIQTYDVSFRKMEDKLYELNNHLGNVMAVITDRKLPIDDGTFDQNGNFVSTTTDNVIDYYSVNVVTYSDYYPYGATLNGRYGGESYRYSFQNQESDPEIKGEGNSINYKYRMHDPRIGRFFAVDPLAPKYPHNSPYAFSENRVTNAVELEGLEASDNVPAKKINGSTRVGDDKIEGNWVYSKLISSERKMDGGWWGNHVTTITSKHQLSTFEDGELINGPVLVTERKISSTVKYDGRKRITNSTTEDSHYLLPTRIANFQPTGLSGFDANKYGLGISFVNFGFKSFESSYTNSLFNKGYRYSSSFGANISLNLTQNMSARAFSNFNSSLTFPKLGSTGRVLGRSLGVASGVFTAIGLYQDYKSYSTGNLSGARFGWRTSGTFLSLAAAGTIGGPFGAAAGIMVGLGFAGGEMAYDAAHSTIKEFNRSVQRERGDSYQEKLNNGLSGGSTGFPISFGF